MNDDIKKSLRTQGKYSGGPNNRDKQQKESPVNKEPDGTKSHARKRNSNGQKEENSSFTGVADDKSPVKHQRKSTHSPIRFPEDDSNSSSVKYQDNSPYSFNELEVQKFTEIRTSGVHILSETDNGPSTIFYEPNFIDAEEAKELLFKLRDTTNWSERNIIIRGTEYPQPRLVAWYGPLPYTYSGVTLEPAEMPKTILRIKDRIEEYLSSHDINVSFNSVLLNYYRNGRDSVSWHSDDELLMSICPTIGSISLGETRVFEMRRKYHDENLSGDEVEECFIKLTHGSLLIMSDCMQLDWQHRIPKEYHDKDIRINLTFRTVHPIDRSPKIMSKDGKKPYENCSSQDAPTSSKINFNETDFPPLSSTLKTDSFDTEEYKNIISPSSNLSSRDNDTKESVEYGSLDTKECEDISPNSDVSSKNNGTSKSIESVSDDLLNYTDMNNTKNWDSEVVNNLKDSWQKTEYDVAAKNINLDDNFSRNSDIACAENSTEEDQSFNSSMRASSEHTYIEPPIPVAPINNTRETLHYAADISVSNLKSNSILNVEAREFVPTISPIPTKFSYDTLDIKHLLEYNIRDINDDELRDYSYALRKKNMDYDVEFEYFDNLNFLNELMEETQSLRTQRLITERMHKLLCEIFDELDYSGNSPKLRGSSSGPEQYNQRDDDNFHRGERNFSDLNFSRGEMYNRNKRQNNRREQQPNRREIVSSQDSSQIRKRRFNRGNYSSRDIQRNKNSDRDYNFSRESFSSKGNKNFNREGYLSYDKFSSVEKHNFNSEKYSGKENKNSNRENCSQRDFSDIRKRDSNEKYFSEDDSSDWAKRGSNDEKDYYQDDFSDSMKRGSNGEKDYNQEEMSSRDDNFKPVIDRKNFNGARRNNRVGFSGGRRRNAAGRGAFFSERGRNASREDFSDGRRKDTSRGGGYSSQKEFPNRRENRSSQEENSKMLPPRFSNRGEKSSGKGYSRNRKESLTQEKEGVAQQ